MATTNPDNALLRQYVELQQRWESQQQPQQQAMGTGLLGGAIGGQLGQRIATNGTDTVQQYDTITTTTDDYSPAYLPTPWKQGTRDYGVVNFYRINEARNDKMSSEPLDELRIKVAKWLYN